MKKAALLLLFSACAHTGRPAFKPVAVQSNERLVYLYRLDDAGRAQQLTAFFNAQERELLPKRAIEFHACKATKATATLRDGTTDEREFPEVRVRLVTLSEDVEFPLPSAPGVHFLKVEALSANGHFRYEAKSVGEDEALADLAELPKPSPMSEPLRGQVDVCP